MYPSIPANQKWVSACYMSGTADLLAEEWDKFAPSPLDFVVPTKHCNDATPACPNPRVLLKGTLFILEGLIIVYQSCKWLVARALKGGKEHTNFCVNFWTEWQRSCCWWQWPLLGTPRLLWSSSSNTTPKCVWTAGFTPRNLHVADFLTLNFPFNSLSFESSSEKRNAVQDKLLHLQVCNVHFARYIKHCITPQPGLAGLGEAERKGREMPLPLLTMPLECSSHQWLGWLVCADITSQRDIVLQMSSSPWAIAPCVLWGWFSFFSCLLPDYTSYLLSSHMLTSCIWFQRGAQYRGPRGGGTEPFLPPSL